MDQRDTAMAEGKVQVERLLARVAEVSPLCLPVCLFVCLSLCLCLSHSLIQVEERASTLSTLLRNNEREYLLLRHNTGPSLTLPVCFFASL
eukprot:COSAG03_NODE_7357_length_929_cov_1.608434_2_plen_91_part_00